MKAIHPKVKERGQSHRTGKKKKLASPPPEEFQRCVRRNRAEKKGKMRVGQTPSRGGKRTSPVSTRNRKGYVLLIRGVRARKT